MSEKNATRKPNNIPEPDWEGFGRKVIKATFTYLDVEGDFLQELALKHNLIFLVPGGFNPLVDYDPEGICEEGDPWYICNYSSERKKEN